jgi:DNA-binding NtrC family response regulator
MPTEKKRDILFIQDDNSAFDANTPAFNHFFNNVDKVTTTQEALQLFEANDYDIVLSDLSEQPEEIGVLKQMKDHKTDQIIFAILSPKDTDKLYGIADMGINAFELLPDQFDLALEEIAKFNP